MSIVTVSRTLPVDIRSAWAALADFGGIHRFHPQVERSPLLNGKNRGLGAERQCFFTDGKNHVSERVTGWDEGRSMVIEIFDGTMPLARAEATLSVEPADGGIGARVTMAMDYTPKMGPLGALMDVLVMRRKFGSMIEQILESLERHLTEAPSAATAAAV